MLGTTFKDDFLHVQIDMMVTRALFHVQCVMTCSILFCGQELLCMCDGRLEHTAVAAPAAATVVQACLLMSQNIDTADCIPCHC